MLVLLAPVQDSGLQPWMGVRISELGAQSRGMLQASDLHFQSVSICLSSSVPLSSANCSLDIQQTPLPPRWQDFLIHDWWVSARLPVAMTMRHSERAYLCFGGWVEGCSAQLRFPIQVSSVL